MKNVEIGKTYFLNLNSDITEKFKVIKRTKDGFECFNFLNKETIVIPLNIWKENNFSISITFKEALNNYMNLKNTKK